MSKEVSGFISWLRSWFDDIYALKGQGGSITLNDVYPIGSIYMSVNSTNPSTLFGGTWVQIEDKFLLASGTNHTLGDTGGEETVTLTANQSGIRAHGHGMSHTHSHGHVAVGYKSGNAASGSARTTIVGRTNTDRSGTYSTDTDATASSKSTTDQNTASNATEAHNNMPPYLTVNIWKRTA